MTFKPDYRAALAFYDEREAYIEQTLQNKAHFSKHAYRAIERAYTKERADMARIRPILEAWIKQESENR